MTSLFTSEKTSPTATFSVAPDAPCQRARTPRQRHKLTLAAGVAAATTVALIAGGIQPASAADVSPTDTVTAVETYGALADTSGLLAASDTVTAASDSDSALVSTTNGVTVDVPRDAGDGVTVTQPDGSSMVVIPPQSGEAAVAPVAQGVAAIPGNDGSSTAVQALEDGTTRFVNVIADKDAPQDFTYAIGVPGGGSVTVNPDGTASALDSSGVVLAEVAKPWATDANGTSVPTWFTTDGASLTQHVDFANGNFAFPIKADPWFWDYLHCIFGVGVPVGAAIFLATEVGTMTAIRAVINQRKAIPAGGPGYKAMADYAQRVYNACSRFIRS